MGRLSDDIASLNMEDLRYGAWEAEVKRLVAEARALEAEVERLRAEVGRKNAVLRSIEDHEPGVRRMEVDVHGAYDEVRRIARAALSSPAPPPASGESAEARMRERAAAVARVHRGGAHYDYGDGNCSAAEACPGAIEAGILSLPLEGR